MRHSVFATFFAALVTLAVAPGALGADMAAGKVKAKICRTCHGIDGIARIPIAPHIAGESTIYLQTQLKAFRSGKRENEIMNVIAGKLTDKEIADLAAWYSAIKVSVTLPDE